MKRNIVYRGAVAVSLVVAIASAFPATVAAADVHPHEGGATQALKLNGGKRWETDAPLRKGMSEIRNSIAADKNAIHASRLSNARYDLLAKKVDAQVAYMIENCKLPPDADAQLHLVIAELVQGSEAMKGKDKSVTRRAGAEKVLAALDAYGRYFDHPGWKAVG